MLKKQAVACALLACAAIDHAGAAKAGPDIDRLQAMSPLQRDAALKALAARPAGAAASGAKLDVTPPVLTGFVIKPPADLATAESQLRVDITATDDMSGVANAWATFEGPHGEMIGTNWNSSMPAKSLATHLVADTTPYMESGPWTLISLSMSDVAGNYAHYDTAALAALGKPIVELVSTQPQLADLTPPAVKSGKVVTPQVSISSFVKGTTSQAPFVGANFTVTDAPTASGIAYVYSTWCLADLSMCLSLAASEGLQGLAKDTLSAYGQAGPWMTPGDYILQYLSVVDHAGNATALSGMDFGGTTDFSLLMPQGHVITLTP
jgi:hypothetical protein